MRSIWQNQSGGLFRSESALSFCDRLSFFSSGAALILRRCKYLSEYLVMRSIKKPGSFDLLGQACGLGRLNLCPVP